MTTSLKAAAAAPGTTNPTATTSSQMPNENPVDAAPAPALAADTLEDFQHRTISSPHELTDWVDNLLDTLQGRFDHMQSAVDGRMAEMSNRIDALESSIEDLIQGHVNTGGSAEGKA